MVNNEMLMTSTAEWREYEMFQALRRVEAGWRFQPPSNSPLQGGRINLVAMGRRVECMAAEMLAERGHQVSLTTHKAHWDMWAGGARVEVKAARWTARAPRGGRYQVHVRNGLADLVLLACIDEAGEIRAWFVLPGMAVGSRQHFSITHRDPAAYEGRWERYRERWELADQVIAAAGPYPGQLELEMFNAETQRRRDI